MNGIAEKVSGKRIQGIDLARAVALVGMAIINFSIAMGANGNGSGWLLWLTELIPGRAAAMFVLLAGVGMSLVSKRARISGDPQLRRNVCRSLYKRALVLFLIGLLFETVWDGDILHYYGIYIAMGTAMLFLSVRWLWLAVLGLNVGFVVMLYSFSYSYGWDWEDFSYSDFWTPVGFLRNLVFNGWHPIFPWFGFLLTGIWLGRLDLRNRSVQLRCLVWGAAVGLWAEAVSWFVVKYLGIGGRGASIFGRECLPPNPMFALESTAGAIFVVALCLMIAEKCRDQSWLRPCVILGQHSLSIYIGHILFGILPLVYLRGMDHENLVSSSLCALIVLGISLLLSLLWRRRFQRGPLEMVLRKITNGKG